MEQTTQQPRAEAEDVFHSRLYAGQIGSGKSVSIAHDVRTLLDADEEYRIIDIIDIADHGRLDVEDEFGTFCGIDEAGHPRADLYEGIHEQPYVRVDAEHGAIPVEQAVQRIHYTFEHASASAMECEHPTVIVIDALPRGIYQDTLLEFVAEARSHGAALWIADLEPFTSGLAEKWVNRTGEIMLHSVPRDPEAERIANLSEADRDHVSTMVTPDHDGNPVLVGRPTGWTHEWVPAPTTEAGGDGQ